MHIAVREGSLSYAQWLMEKGANPLKKKYDGESPLDLARRLEYMHIHKLLESYTAGFESASTEEGGICKFF